MRLWTLRSTAVYSVLLIGSCVGPIILMTFLYDIEYQGPIDAGDLGKCASIFHMLAVVFAGASAATEIRSGSTEVSFLTQRRRWTSFAAQLLATSSFLSLTYVIGMALAFVAAQFYPDGLIMSAKGWSYLGVYLSIILVWGVVAMSLAVLTRSVAAAIAVPLVWMLLLEQLMSMVPMLAPVMNWMPFSAGMELLGRVLAESPVAAGSIPAVVLLSGLASMFSAAGLLCHTRRDVPG